MIFLYDIWPNHLVWASWSRGGVESNRTNFELIFLEFFELKMYFRIKALFYCDFLNTELAWASWKCEVLYGGAAITNARNTAADQKMKKIGIYFQHFGRKKLQTFINVLVVLVNISKNFRTFFDEVICFLNALNSWYKT